MFLVAQRFNTSLPSQPLKILNEICASFGTDGFRVNLRSLQTIFVPCLFPSHRYQEPQKLDWPVPAVEYEDKSAQKLRQRRGDRQPSAGNGGTRDSGFQVQVQLQVQVPRMGFVQLSLSSSAVDGFHYLQHIMSRACSHRRAHA